MKLVSFQVPTPVGAQTRIGAIDSDQRIVDLAAAYRARLVSSGLTALSPPPCGRVTAPSPGWSCLPR
jgi:hypothetical protein